MPIHCHLRSLEADEKYLLADQVKAVTAKSKSQGVAHERDNAGVQGSRSESSD
jgi:hypothetical protein